ncbi:hypothetical protein QQ045_026996 [Rhodiola kirilowii]
MVSMKRFQLRIGGTYSVKGTAEKAMAKNKSSIDLLLFSRTEVSRKLKELGKVRRRRWVMVMTIVEKNGKEVSGEGNPGVK